MLYFTIKLRHDLNEMKIRDPYPLKVLYFTYKMLITSYVYMSSHFTKLNRSFSLFIYRKRIIVH